jgi:signal transduction histidine kinase
MPNRKYIRAGLQVRAVKIQFNSIRLKLTLFYTVILVLLLFAFHFIAYMLFSAGLFNNLDSSLKLDSEQARDKFGVVDSDVNGFLTGLESALDSSVYIYDVTTGEILSNSGNTEEIKDKLSGITTASGKRFLLSLDTGDERLRLYVAPMDIETEPDKLIVVSRSADYIYNTVDSYKKWLYMAIPFVIIIALVSGYLLSGYFLRQVKAINTTAEKIDPANIIDRIPVKSNDELGRLSKTLNSLFDRIHGYAERQKQFTADASHDLRSPLTIIKAEAEVTLMRKRKPEEYIAAIQTMDDAANVMNDMVDDLLTLASMDSQPDISAVAAFDLSACMENAVYDWKAPFENKGVEIRRDIAPGIVVRGDPAHFRRIADNLVKNAFEHTPAGGSVTCSLKVSKGNIIITVADTGTGIAEEHLPRIFDRFYKVDRDTPGNGLGLPIVEGTVKMYGGSVTAESEFGKGSVFTVVMPAKQPYYITFDD